MGISFTEENYLKAIFNLSQAETPAEVSTTQISKHLKNKAASVTDMLKRLSEKKLIDYKPYKGVKLTEKGRKTAIKVVRKHRLWEVFLVQKLNYKWDEVHEIAEQLEHIHSDSLIEKLSVFLGDPKFDPHGDPIPDSSGKFFLLNQTHLNVLRVNQTAIITGVSDHSSEFLKYLTKSGIKIGDQLKIELKNNYDNSLSVKLNKNKNLFLSAKVASNILVKVKV